ncbi:MAG: dTMP kinase [Coriobacteriaceae bacterium]|nr:dTMP kinase [Coriobacteriaceae bacterium]
MAQGVFITVEGIDGCGKTTQARLLELACAHAGLPVRRLREPGGSEISEKIRALLLDPSHTAMGDTCELMLYEAARAQLVHEVIRPALDAGELVVCDRFYDSTTAYQSFADGLPLKTVLAANALAVGQTHPDLTLYFRIDPEVARTRTIAREQDRMEAKGFEFQRRVAEGFGEVARLYPDRVVTIDAAASAAEVFAAVARAVARAGVTFSAEDVSWALEHLERDEGGRA